jgi:hypothetical protein
MSEEEAVGEVTSLATSKAVGSRGSSSKKRKAAEDTENDGDSVAISP